MEIEKIRNLSDDELKAQHLKSGEELFRLRFRMKLGNPEGVKRLRGLKLDIARINTIARERELHIERAAKPEPVAAKAEAASGEESAAKRNATTKGAAKPGAKKASAGKAAAGAKKAAAKKATTQKTGKKD